MTWEKHFLILQIPMIYFKLIFLAPLMNLHVQYWFTF